MKIVSYTFIFLFILSAFQMACGQTQTKTDELTVKVITKEEVAEMIKTAYPNLKTQAEVMRKAFLAEDFGRYTDFMYSTNVEVVGGREKFISGLRSSFSNLRSNGVEFVGYEIGEPIQKIEMDNKVFVVLPYETKMKSRQRTTTEEGNILAVSEDKGESWKFIRATSKERLRFLFPKLVDKLNFSESRMK
jgi:hypothetical protein